MNADPAPTSPARSNGTITSIIARLLAYDAVQPLLRDQPAFRAAHRLALGLLGVFVVLGIAFIVTGAIDNKPTTASTGLVSAHRSVSMNWGGWFTEGIWWRGQQTPTPLPFTIHGLLFSVFGYTVHGVLILHTFIGACIGWLLFRVTARRYGSWAGLLAMGLCLAAPLFLYVTFAGWTFVWATLFLLLAIDLSDRAALTRQARWFLLAGLALGCAGMSRPENYAAAAVFVLLAPATIRYRAIFLLLVFAYPLAQYVVNNLLHGAEPGLRILDDARSGMSYTALFQEWFGRVQRAVLNRNFAGFTQWALIPVVLCFGLPRHRLLTGILVYFWVAFFAAYAMRRISFNHEGYYFAHVVLTMPFLAAALAWLTGRIRAGVQRTRLQARAASAVAIAVVFILAAANQASVRRAYADRLFYKAPEPVRELRDFLVAHLEDDDAVVIDYFSEVSWMLAEIEGNGGRTVYFYNTNPTGEPRPPVNAARKDLAEDEFAPLNAWVGRNLEAWLQDHTPRFIVMLSGPAWERERTRRNAMGHYRLFGLRPALKRVTDAGEPPLLPLAGRNLAFANSEFHVYGSDEAEAPGPLVDESFDVWPDGASVPVGWRIEPPESGAVSRGTAADGGGSVTLHPQSTGMTRLIYESRDFPEAVPGAVLEAEIRFQAPEPGSVILLLGFKRQNGESYNVKLENTGRPSWETVSQRATLPGDIEPGFMFVAVNLREPATKPVSVARIAVRPVFIPE